MAVMGHVGLTPQSISVLGGFRPAAQTAKEALRVIKQAKVGTEMHEGVGPGTMVQRVRSDNHAAHAGLRNSQLDE